MSVLAVVCESDQIRPLMTWAIKFSAARKTTLTVLCWSHSSVDEFPLLASEESVSESDTLVEEARQILKEIQQSAEVTFDSENVHIKRSIGPDSNAAALDEIRSQNHRLVLAVSKDETGETGATYATNSLLKNSPCETVIFFRAGHTSRAKKHVLITSVGSPHEQAALELFTGALSVGNLQVTLARIEDETGDEAIELGQRELKRLMRDAGIKSSDKVKRRVFSGDEHAPIIAAAEKNDLVVVGANEQRLVHQLHLRTSKPGVVVVKRAPPLRQLRRKWASKWRTRLSPADYADLIQGLRRGSELNVDFLCMLGLAAAIATLGLLQNSPAVVIGSMLLAPLMTPMISCGLAIAQGNQKLGRRSMKSIGVGFLMTLVISFLLAFATPGDELTPEVVSRGSPNSLDLLIALFSAAAAAYALARPNIAGAVAGVAIATALVPPLCATGISLAYREYLNAHGCALLFATNLVAIVLGAAVMFRVLGVTLSKAGEEQRRWVRRISAAIAVSLIILAFPLERSLDRMIDQGRNQPATFPLSKPLMDALTELIAADPDVQLVACGRPSSLHDPADVVIVLSSTKPLEPKFAKEIQRICQREMSNNELSVEVHCLTRFNHAVSRIN